MCPQFSSPPASLSLCSLQPTRGSYTASLFGLGFRAVTPPPTFNFVGISFGEWAEWLARLQWRSITLFNPVSQTESSQPSMLPKHSYGLARIQGWVRVTLTRILAPCSYPASISCIPCPSLKSANSSGRPQLKTNKSLFLAEKRTLTNMQSGLATGHSNCAPEK